MRTMASASARAVCRPPALSLLDAFGNERTNVLFRSTVTVLPRPLRQQAERKAGQEESYTKVYGAADEARTVHAVSSPAVCGPPASVPTAFRK
jgi:hypothetical protein